MSNKKIWEINIQATHKYNNKPITNASWKKEEEKVVSNI